MWGAGGRFVLALLACLHRVHWCRCAGFRGLRTCRRLALVLWSCVPSFCPSFLLCSRCIACKYGSISRFKGVFSVVWAFRVGLCGLGALRGLCGFCARVELGGLKTCGVFASILSVFHLLCPCLVFLLLCLPPFMLVVLLCSGCLFLSSCIVFVVAFSLTDYT